MSTTQEDRRPPRWMVARGVPEDAVAVHGGNGPTRFIRGQEVWALDPLGRLTHVVWRDSTPPAPAAVPVVTPQEAVAALARPPRSESYEEFCARQQALGLAVQLGMVKPATPKAPPGPDRPGTDHPDFERFMTALAAFANAPERVEDRERSTQLAMVCEAEMRVVLDRRASGTGRFANRAREELDAMNRRARARGERL